MKSGPTKAQKRKGRQLSRTANADRPALALPPQAKWRKCANWWIGLFLTMNLLLPLRYYVSRWEGTMVDDRFAWRMFSAESMQRAEIALWETIRQNGQWVVRPLPIETVLQPAWDELLRDRLCPSVAEQLLRNHCRLTSAKRVRFQRTGTWPDGSAVEPFVLARECDE